MLEHVADDAAAVAEFRRVLRPGGSAVVSVPAYPWLWSGHDVAQGHRRRYTKRTLEALLRGGGFRVRRLGHFNAFLLPGAVALRLFRRSGAQSDLRRAPSPLNALLLRALRAERKRVLAGGFPFGLSVFAVSDRL